MINQPRVLDEIEIEADVGIPLSGNRSATEEISDKMDNTTEGIRPPNGGLRAWTVVAASFFIQTFTFTSEFMFGVFEHNYLMIYPDVGPSKISLIGIIASCTTYLTGFISGSLSDRYGYRQTASIGALIMTVSLVLASFSTQLWHLYLTQGLMMGFGASLAYYAAVGAPAHWFTSRRGVAMGISSAGAGVGGFYLAPLTQFLVTKTGIPWTLRALALYCLCACGIASLLLAEYKQPQITSMQKGQNATCKDEGLAASRTSMAFKLLPIVRMPIFQAYRSEP
ncbi:hypothetical protein BGW42_005608 [Actinomortierella wolfii]|nr:hypothetical protein BGW42_005608 [Actinomortierella wolfii]